MKKLVALAAVIAAVSFTSCGNKSAESTDEVANAETTTVEETATVVEKEATDVTATEEAPADSVAVEAAPAE